MQLWILVIILAIYFVFMVYLLSGRAMRYESLDAEAQAAPYTGGYYLISWDPPTDNGGDPTITYNITINQNSTNVISQTGLTSPSYQFTTFGWETTYDVSVVAVNSGGTSPAVTTTFTTGGQPGVTISSIVDATSGNPPLAGQPVGNLIATVTIDNADDNTSIGSETALIYTDSSGGACNFTAGSLTKVNDNTYSVTFTPSTGAINTACQSNYTIGTIALTLQIYNAVSTGTGTYNYTIAANSPNAPGNISVKFTA